MKTASFKHLYSFVNVYYRIIGAWELVSSDSIMNAELTILRAGNQKESHTLNRAEAIALFQHFPLEKELAAAQESEMDEPVSFTFRSAELGELILAAYTSDYFEIILTKNGKTGEDYLTGDLKQNTSGTAPEDFIAAYYDGDLHEHMSMSDIPEESDSVITYTFAQKSKIKFLLIPVVLLIGWILIFIKGRSGEQTSSTGFTFITGFLFLASLPSIWFFSRYYKQDKNKSISIDKKTGTVTIERNGNSVRFTKKELEFCRIFSGRSSFRYISFTLKNGNQYSITNFIAEPYEIAMDLKVQPEVFATQRPVFSDDSEI